jgi:hypothetical protein
MQDQVSTISRRIPCNKGKVAGAKPRCANMSGRSGRNFRAKVVLATLPCSIWQSTASFVAVMSSPSGSRMSPPAGTRRIALRSVKENRAASQIELSEQTRQAVNDYLKATNKRPGEFLFTGRRGPDRK